MQLKKLFDAQKELSNRIMEEHPELKGQDNLPWKILAFQVEVSELANEWRGFKMWSHDKEPRKFKECIVCRGTGKVRINIYDKFLIECPNCKGCKGTNPLLEEYADGFHFLLDIGLELGLDDRATSLISKVLYTSDNPIMDLFMEVNAFTSELYWSCSLNDNDHETIEQQYKAIFDNYVQLGNFLGFTWEEIEAAYFEKNKINHERQQNKY